MGNVLKLAALRTPSAANYEVGVNNDAGNFAGVVTLKGFEWVFSNVVSILIAGAGLTAFVLLLVSGIKFITAGGDPKQLEGAKKSLSFAIIGVVLIAVSYLIIQLIQWFTGANLSTFNVVLNP